MVQQMQAPGVSVAETWEPFSVTGLNTLVTGGAMGIGRGIVARFAEGGANVLLADLDEEAATRTAAQLGDQPGRVVAQRLDVSSADACESAVQRCVAEFGSIAVLVNVAGIYPISPVLEMTEAFFDRVIAVNLKGLVLMSQAAGRQFVQQGKGGRIVNIGSIDSIHPSSVGLAAYDASKGGVLMFSKNFALEMAPHQVNVNVIAPGGINTEGTAASLKGVPAEQMDTMLAEFAKMIPLGRMGEPDDIAGVAIFLASPAARYMTGSLVVVDGGRLLA
jgi:2-deoxy-D-gluconate 3-dehydrogenase